MFANSIAKVTASIDAATLKTVLPRRIVTNNLRGCSNNERIYLFNRLFLPFKSFKWFLSKEKRATSDPENSAENMSVISSKINLENQSISNYLLKLPIVIIFLDHPKMVNHHFQMTHYLLEDLGQKYFLMIATEHHLFYQVELIH